MPLPDLIIRGDRVILPALVGPASIHISDGRITEVAAYDELPAGCEIVDVDKDSVVMPGLVDTHVHINEPGRTEWEGFATATRAAAAGGVTTLVDMPLNSIPPTTTVEGFRAKLEAARGQCYVDIGFWGGVVPENTAELGPLFNAGVIGFKCFLVHSGVDEFPNVTEHDLREAMPELARLGAVLIVHAELPGPISRTGIPACHDDAPGDTTGGTGIPACHDDAGRTVAEGSTDKNFCPAKYETFLRSRPRAAENEAVDLMIRLSRELGTRVHIVHHSSADALGRLREAKAGGVRITAETCPHYLHFAAEEIPDGATEYKCCPPIRERENREQLWSALAEGTIDMVVSDHSPCPSDMKCLDSGDFMRAWGGISSLQLRLPATWTEAQRRGYSVSNLAEWLCAAPAKLVGLDQRKGKIAVGHDADIVVWNPDKEFRVGPEMIEHRHKLTPYTGQVLRGVVEKTFLRGRLVYNRGEFPPHPYGDSLLRESISRKEAQEPQNEEQSSRQRHLPSVLKKYILSGEV